jgi:hypothetical protein
MHALVTMLASTGHGALPSAPETADMLASREALEERLSCLRRLAPPPPARSPPPPPSGPSAAVTERGLPPKQPTSVSGYGEEGVHPNSPLWPFPPSLFIADGGYVSPEAFQEWQPGRTRPAGALGDDFPERFSSPTLSSLLCDPGLPDAEFSTPVINSPLLGDRPVLKTGAGGAGRALAFGDQPFPPWAPAHTERLKSAFSTKELLTFYLEAFPDSELSERSRKTKDFLIGKMVDEAPDVAFRALAQALPEHADFTARVGEETDMEEEAVY